MSFTVQSWFNSLVRQNPATTKKTQRKFTIQSMCRTQRHFTKCLLMKKTKQFSFVWMNKIKIKFKKFWRCDVGKINQIWRLKDVWHWKTKKKLFFSLRLFCYVLYSDIKFFVVFIDRVSFSFNFFFSIFILTCIRSSGRSVFSDNISRAYTSG